MEKMKICQTIDSYYPIIDGAIECSRHYTLQLNRKEKAFLVVPKAGRKKRYVDNEEFSVFRCLSFPAPEKYRYGLPLFDRKFKKKIMGEKIDLIHTHSPYSMGRFAVKVARKKKIPIVATLHTQYHLDFMRTLKGSRLLTRFMLKYILKVYDKADSVWTVSERACECLRSYGYKGNIEVVRNGTDFRYPENVNSLIERVNTAHGIEERKNVFLFVGRLAWYKNIKLILDGLKKLKENGNDFLMIFVGGGFDHNDIANYTKKINIDNNCLFVGKVADRELLQGYYLRSDLMIFPSTFDTSGIVKVEAAAHKKACVLVKDSCSAEQVFHGENGFLCEENEQSLSEVLIDLCANPSLMKQAGEKAYDTLFRTWEDVSEEVLSKYKKIIEDYKIKNA